MYRANDGFFFKSETVSSADHSKMPSSLFSVQSTPDVHVIHLNHGQLEKCAESGYDTLCCSRAVTSQASFIISW